jgi:hypothetical protein
MKARIQQASDSRYGYKDNGYDLEVSTIEELQEIVRKHDFKGWGKRLILEFDESTEIEPDTARLVQVKRPLTVTIYDYYVE